MQHFLGDPESGKLNLEHYCLTIAIAKKTLDENYFRNAQKTTDRKPPSFQLGNRVDFKNKQPGKMGLKMETWVQDCFVLSMKDTTYRKPINGKTRSCNVKDIVLEPPIEF